MPGLRDLFPTAKPVIGMIHLLALPGTPAYLNDNQKIIDTAIEEADLYLRSGIDGLMIENMHDVPYLKREVGPEISSLMSVIAYEVKKRTMIPCGVQVLAGANKAALAIAKAANLDFIRAEGFVFGHLADEGFMDSDAGDLLRYRRSIGADNILIFTDIKKKHSSHSITQDIDIVETAKAASFFRSDGIIATGSETGVAADPGELRRVKAASDLPVLVGSGVNLDNLRDFLEVADGMIVGSYFKKGGYWATPVEEERVKEFMAEVQRLR